MDPGDPFASEYMGMAYLADHTEIVTNRYVGVGGARATAVEHAAEQGHASIVMSDDDIAPAITSDGPSVRTTASCWALFSSFK